MPMYDTSAFAQAGITPSKSILKYGNAIDQNGNVIVGNPLMKNLKYDSLFAIMKEQNRIEVLERYQWVNVPFGLTADLIERVLFYRGKGVLYYNDKVEKFQFLPFALNGAIDEYGRYQKVNTLPFTGVSLEEEKKHKKELPTVYEDLEIVYDLPYDEETLRGLYKKPVGVILNDSSIGISQQPIIRDNYVKPILHLMATLIQIINTAMFGAADHSLIQVGSESELASLNSQINAINLDILNGKRFTGVVGELPITPLKSSSTANLEGLFNTFNSLNNLLKSISGVQNAGVFDKKAQLLQSEQALNGSNADDIYFNGLRMRQEACMLIQAYYGYPIWCISKRPDTAGQIQNDLTGETDPTMDTQQNNVGGNTDNASS